MTTYYYREEIRTGMKVLVDEYLKDCTNGKQLSEDFTDLIKHNFLAKFVCYDKTNNTMEIGVENFSSNSSYPEIKIYTYPLNSKNDWLDNSYKTGKNDFAFYGRLLNRKKDNQKNSKIVII